jgi:hypothetical protein
MPLHVRKCLTDLLFNTSDENMALFHDIFFILLVKIMIKDFIDRLSREMFYVSLSSNQPNIIFI